MRRARTRYEQGGGSGGFIDLFWRGTLIAEHKSRGHNLDTAYKQALGYFEGLAERDLPRYVIVSDFARIRLYDLDVGTRDEFPLKDLKKILTRCYPHFHTSTGGSSRKRCRYLLVTGL